MNGYWLDVKPGSELTIDNIVGDTHFFFPIISNNTNYDCEISVNDGLEDEYRPGTISAKQDNVWIGYYYLFNNSNVTLYCDNDTVYWWGLRPGERKGASFFDEVSVKTGAIKLVLSPQQSADGLSLVPVAATRTPAIDVVNQLQLPVKIYIDDNYKGTVNAYSVKTFIVTNHSVQVDWEIVKETTTEGNPIGDDMSGHWDGVNVGETIYLDNIVDDEYYFYPIMTNNSKYRCEFSINDGWQYENRPDASIPSKTQRAGLGYYRLFTNSNVTLYCDDGNIYWWGIRLDDEQEKGTSFSSNILDDSGVIKFVYTP